MPILPMLRTRCSVPERIAQWRRTPPHQSGATDLRARAPAWGETALTRRAPAPKLLAAHQARSRARLLSLHGLRETLPPEAIRIGFQAWRSETDRAHPAVTADHPRVDGRLPS